MRFPENLKKGGTIGFVAPSFGCHIIGQALAYLLDEVMAERLPNARDALLNAAIRQFGGMS